MSSKFRIRLRHLLLLMSLISLPCALIFLAEANRRQREIARERLRPLGIDLSPTAEDPPSMSMAERVARSVGLTPWKKYWCITVDGKNSVKGYDLGLRHVNELSCFSEVTALFLIDSSDIHGEYLESIANLHSVNCLSIDGCDQLTPSDLRFISTNFDNIKTLKLRNLRHIKCVDDIPNCLYSNCSYLDIDGINANTSDIEVMLASNNLKILSLSRLFIEQVARVKLAGRGKVEVLCLDQVENLTPVLERIAMDRSVLRLHIRNCRLVDRDWDAISKLENIRFVEISNCDIGDKCWTYISRLVNLKYLDLTNTQVQGDGIGAIASLPHLHELILKGNRFTQEGIRDLTSLPHLSRLHAPDNFTASDRLSFPSESQGALYLEMNGFAGWLSPPQFGIPGVRQSPME